MPKATLSQRPRLDRLAAIGIAPPKDGEPLVDRDGGEHKAGLIRGVAVITRGPALGHGMFIDATTLQQTAALINDAPKGAKSRFTHPGLSGDGAGKLLGRAKQASVEGDIVRADLHLTKTAHATPDGDLAGYVMGLAEDDPEAFGNSIAFEHDIEAENAFVEANGGEVLDPEWGFYDLTAFKSPDPGNTENTFHVRLKELRAVDVVDEPAANPSGLFHRGQEIPAAADALCEYAFGLSDTRPASAELGIDPDRLRGYASRFLSSRGLTVAKGAPMPKGKLTAAVAEPEKEATETTVETSEQTADEGATAPPPSPTAESTDQQETSASDGTDGDGGASSKPEDEKEAALSAARAELSKFIALDPVDGPKWFSAGKTLAEAQALTIEKLKAEKETLSTKLAAVNRGEKAPVSFSDAETDETPAPPRRSGLTEGQARFAAALTMPSRN